jgi:hypothetical protein
MAIGDYTEKRLVGPFALSLSVAAGGPPSNMIWIVKQIIAANTGTSVSIAQVSVEAGLPSNPASARVVDINVQPKDVECINTYLIVDGSAGEKMGFQGASSSPVTVTVCGLQKQIS